MDIYDDDDNDYNGFGELPESRGNGVQIAKRFGSAIFFIILLSYRLAFKEQNIIGLDDAGRFCVVVLSVYTAQLIKSVYLFVEERKHTSSRHGNSLKKTFQACLAVQSEKEVYYIITSKHRDLKMGIL